MQDIEFDWDENKNELNKQKHKISFEEASTVFYDKYSILSYDESHSDDEDRFIIMGESLNNNILLVCHCLRDDHNIVA